MDGVGAVGGIEKIKLLYHGIFARGGGLKSINLGTGGEEGDLTGAVELIDLP